MTSIVYPDGRLRTVKNLGWLLRNWKNVDHFKVVPGTIKEHHEAKLYEYMTDGTFFRANFADKTVLWNWLKRPVFLGLTVDWFGEEHIISKQKEW